MAGIGAANVSIANAYVSDISNSQNRARNFGIIGAAIGLGFIFGPPLGGLLKNHFGIEGVGYVAAGLSFINVLIAWLLLPESNLERNSKRKLFTTPLREFKTVLPRVTIRNLLIIHLIFMAAFSMLQMTASLLWRDKFDLIEMEIGYTFGFVGICMVIVQGLLLGRLSRIFGEQKLFITGNFLMAIGLLSMPYVPAELFIPLELVGLVFIAFGTAFFSPTLSSLLTQNARDDEQGKVLGLMQSMGSLARIIGPVTGGFFYGLSLYLPFTVAAGIMLITGIMAFRLVKIRLSP
ncbi:MAG: MFS transporter [Owenweeksia sp.]|nr:MFS transporter [Owenweeksia sp.]